MFADGSMTQNCLLGEKWNRRNGDLGTWRNVEMESWTLGYLEKRRQADVDKSEDLRDFQCTETAFFKY